MVAVLTCGVRGLGDLLARGMAQKNMCMDMFRLCSILDWKTDAGLHRFLLCPEKIQDQSVSGFHSQLGFFKYKLMLPLPILLSSTFKCTCHFCWRIRSYIYWCGSFVGSDWT